MKAALLVVDVQSYFVKKAPAGFAAKIADYIAASNYDYVAFTVFRNTAHSNFVKSLNWKDCQTEEDARLADELSPFVSTTDIDDWQEYYFKPIKKLLEQEP